MKERHPDRHGAREPLPSWNDSASRSAIVAFVEAVCTANRPGFVPEDERIAVFDNDGTLWCERPVPVQLFFAMDRLHQLAERDPRLREEQPFRAFLERDLRTIATFGKREAFEFAARTHSGISPDEFSRTVQHWLESARHPTLDRLFTACAYQPQLELLEYLRAHGFRTFIVSGGGVAFMRVFTEALYGVPPEQVIGSSNRTRVRMQDGVPSLLKLAELRSFDDREEKVVNIELHIGRRPIFAFGNSDGDLRMLQYTAAGAGRRLVLLLHHDDAAREFAYDKDFRLSPLDEALQEARELNWSVVSMRQDWRCVFPGPRDSFAVRAATAVGAHA